MRILKIIGIAVAGIIALFLIAGLFLPSSFRVERSIEIAASPEVVFEQVVDFRNWPKWDPFTEQDRAAQLRFSDPSRGVGAKWSWQGEVIGTGSLTIREAVENKSVRSKLVSIAPRQWEGDDLWDFAPAANGTKVTWTSIGALNYPIARYIGLFTEGMLGPILEKGLANLKKHTESVQVELSSSN
jgi:hypothetical protein